MTTNAIMRRNGVAVAQPQQTIEVSNEDIFLSLADANKTLNPISDNTVYFEPLDPKAKAFGITLDQLRESSDLKNTSGDLNNGINAYQLIDKVAEIAREFHSECAIGDLFVADNKNRAQGNGIQINTALHDIYKQQSGTENIPFKATTFNRVFCNIALNRQHTDTHVANIVVTTNQSGLQVAIGAHCYACRNQTVLGASHMVSTYGNKENRQMDLPTFIQRVRMMIQGYSFQDDMRILNMMQQIPIDNQTMVNIFGELSAIRVAYDSQIRDVHDMADCKVYPMAGCQINKFIESVLLTLARKGSLTLYDLYQSATAIYKVAYLDMPNVLPQNQAFAEFVNDRFSEYNLNIH